VAGRADDKEALGSIRDRWSEGAADADDALRSDGCGIPGVCAVVDFVKCNRIEIQSAVAGELDVHAFTGRKSARAPDDQRRIALADFLAANKGEKLNELGSGFGRLGRVSFIPQIDPSAVGGGFVAEGRGRITGVDGRGVNRIGRREDAAGVEGSSGAGEMEVVL
jgi:hypothetical protein